MGRPCPATHSLFVSVARRYFQFFWTKYVVSRQIKSRILAFSNKEANKTLALSLTLLAAKKKTIIVRFGRTIQFWRFDFRWYYRRCRRM